MKSNTAQAGTAKSNSAINLPPFNVREGDLFCAFHDKMCKAVLDGEIISNPAIGFIYFDHTN